MPGRNEEFAEAREKLKGLLEEVGLDLNSKKRERLAYLLKRASWLRSRIQSLALSGKTHHYDEMEVVTTEWAVNHIIVLEAEIKRLRDPFQEREISHQPITAPNWGEGGG